MGFLDTLKQMFKIEEKPAFDASVFGDPLAENLEWTPLVHGGTSIRTHELDFQSSQRLEFRATVGARVFAAIFMIIPFVLVIAASTKPHFPWIVLIMATVFLAGGIGMWRSFTKPIVFDKGRGWYWKSRKDPREKPESACKLDQIHALQILSERCKTKKSHYYSYELNIVLHDGSRLSVLDHGRIEELRVDAQRLAEFLAVPIWEKPE